MCRSLARDDRVNVIGSLSILPTSVFKTVFVLSDVITLLAQTVGGIMQVFDSVANIGRIVIIAGIAAQSMSYVIFTCIVVRSHRRWKVSRWDPLRTSLQRLYVLLYISSALILVSISQSTLHSACPDPLF